MKKARSQFRRVGEKIFVGVVITILILYTISLFYPLFWALYSSLKDVVEYTLYKFQFPKHLRFQNYLEVFSLIRVPIDKPGVAQAYVYMPEMFLNSFVYCTGVAFLNVFVPAMTAYVVNKFRFVGRNLIYSIAIITMIIPIVGNLPSLLRLMKDLHFYDNIFGVFIMLGGAFGFNFLILYSAFSSLSWSYAEAARVDGANHFKIYFSVMLPLVKPVLTSLFVLSFIGNWNDYMTPMIYLKNMPTIAYGAFQFQFEVSSGAFTIPHMLAGFIVAMIPIIIVFLIFQKTIMNNVTAGGLKG